MTRLRVGALVAAAGRRVHVRVDGPTAGPALLLVHGLGGSLHWFDRLTALLADTHRVLRVDLLGHGCTGGPGADADEQASVVAGVLAQLDVTGVTALGHSFGADVVLALAGRGGPVRRVVLLAQAPDYRQATFPRGNALLTLPGVGALLHRAAPRAAVRRVAAHAVAPGFRLGRALDRQVLLDHRALDPGMFRVALVDRRARLAARPLDAQVRDLGLPTLAVLGGRDRFYGDRAAARYRAAGARVAVFPDCGHSPNVEAPARLAHLLRDFTA